MRLIIILGVLLLVNDIKAQTQTTYEYDKLNRLVKVTTPISVTNYTYDNLGNRMVKKTKVDATAVLPVKTESGFRLYPNPAQESTTVVCPKDAVGQTLRIIDAEGRCVIAQRVEAESTNLRLDGMPSGVYIVNIGSNKHSAYTAKLLKE